MSGEQLSQRPVDSDFYQQRLKAWQPILTPFYVVLTFLAIGGPFVGLGFWLKSVSDKVVEVKYQYDGEGAMTSLCSMGSMYNGTKTCTINITAPAEMKAPVYVYYELQNFYQNHRRYVKSVSSSQLAGTLYTDVSASGLSDCDPLKSRDGLVLDPCGLIANSYFNDSFSILPAGQGSSASFAMDETSISWESDRTKKFKPLTDAQIAQAVNKTILINQLYPALQPNATNEHFIVWMRPAALPNFRKLYGRIEQDIPAGAQLAFAVQLNYPVAGFSGKKSLVLSTVSFLGGKNPFMGIAFIAVGFICIGLALLFAAKQACGGRRPADTGFLVWQSKN